MSNFSWIQYHIFLELTRHAQRRYGQLRPNDVEGNLFAYHLKGLIADGMIEKVDGQYGLTAKGLQFVSTLSMQTGRTRRQPKIVNAIICRNDKGEYLMSRWHRQPNAGLISFPHGMMHYGEPIMAMASRELAEKSGLRADLAYRGDIYVRVEMAQVVDRHMLVHLFEATNIVPGAEGHLRPDVSESFWASIGDVQREQFVPGFYEIAQLADNTPKEAMIFADIVIEIGEPA